MSFFATSSVAEVIDSAMSVSSECRRGLRLCSWSVFRRQMGVDGLVADHVDVVVHAGHALERVHQKRRLAAPSSVDVLPVTTVPSGSTIAPAGAPVVSSFSSAAERAGD